MSTITRIRKYARAGNITKLIALRGNLFDITPEEYINAAFAGICCGSMDNVEPFLRAMRMLPMKLMTVSPNTLVLFVSRVCMTGHGGAINAAMQYTLSIIPMTSCECVNCAYWERIIVNIMTNGVTNITSKEMIAPACAIEVLARAGAIMYIGWEHVYTLIRSTQDRARTRLPSIDAFVTRSRALDRICGAPGCDADSKCDILRAMIDASRAWGCAH